MKKGLILLTVLLVGVFLAKPYLSPGLIQAGICERETKDDLDEISSQIEDCRRALEDLLAATANLEESLDEIRRILDNLAVNIESAKVAIAKKQAELILLTEKIISQEQELDYLKEILAQRVRSLYIRSQFESVDLAVLSVGNSSQTTLDLAIKKAITAEDKRVIASVSAELASLKEDKTKAEELQKDLEYRQVQLEESQQEYEEQAAFFEKEIEGAKAYQEELEKKIAELTTKQQQLIAEKLASLNLPATLGAGPLYCTDDRDLDPGFSPGLAFYTFGIPHRVGMNQYGALGRAKAGQNSETILMSYYQNVRIECRSTPNRKIKVQGYGEMDVEEYLKGIYEMPGDWPLDALKAQVVAARSYALAYTHNGENEICTTQHCQVYKGGNKGGQWEEAVKQTGEQACSDGQGRALVSNDTNEVISAWYASTSGGYTFTSADVGWRSTPWTKRMRDTSGDVGSFDDLYNTAYDQDSPCFYSAQGWRSEYGKSAWLKPEEVADIVNILLLAKKDTTVQKHLPQVDKPNPDGVETWDAERVKSELRSRGETPFNFISGVSVEWDRGGGRTTTVQVSGDAGSRSFEGGEFKDFFNLRAPANIQIVGPLYKVETR
jgi:SpoIID/LytB domain protein